MEVNMDDLPWGHSIITLEDRLQEIENLLSSKFYQAALALALTVPDICGKVEFPKEGVHDRYTKWFALHVEHNFEPVHLPEDENDAAPDYSKRALNGEMCYRLRCAFLHSGSDDINETRQVAPINAGDYPDYSVTFDFVLSEDKTEFTCGTDDREKSKHFTYYIAIPKLCRCICTAAKECIRKYSKEAFTGKCKIYSRWKWQQDYLEEMGE